MIILINKCLKYAINIQYFSPNVSGMQRSKILFSTVYNFSRPDKLASGPTLWKYMIFPIQ